MKVKATKKGWFNGQRQKAGSEFVITSRLDPKSSKELADKDIESQFSPSWMEKIVAKPASKTRSKIKIK